MPTITRSCRDESPPSRRGPVQRVPVSGGSWSDDQTHAYTHDTTGFSLHRLDACRPILSSPGEVLPKSLSHRCPRGGPESRLPRGSRLTPGPDPWRERTAPGSGWAMTRLGHRPGQAASAYARRPGWSACRPESVPSRVWHLVTRGNTSPLGLFPSARQLPYRRTTPEARATQVRTLGDEANAWVTRSTGLPRGKRRWTSGTLGVCAVLTSSQGGASDQRWEGDSSVPNIKPQARRKVAYFATGIWASNRPKNHRHLRSRSPPEPTALWETW